ncbi:MAG: glycosyltransferase family 2 protein [Anaerolineae bacterium]|nr:glycosyltransferase family 2 protein [Anaerolineae bacterium]
MNLPISIVILTLNEEQNIAHCLDSVKDWAGELFVVDSGSTDRTVEIARHFSANVVTNPFINYAQQRNWSQDNLPLTYDWVFHLDAGEQVTPELAAALRKAFSGSGPTVDGFLINRRAIFMGRWIKHGGIYPTYHLRLYRHSKGCCEEREYDQHFKVEGRVATLDGDLIDEIAPDLNSWTLSHARWASAEAAEQLKQSQPDTTDHNQVQGRLFGTAIERRRWLRRSVYGRVPLFVRPFAYFIYRYFLRLGFLDGIEGFIFHFLQGFWYRFYVDAKIWEWRMKN